MFCSVYFLAQSGLNTNTTPIYLIFSLNVTPGLQSLAEMFKCHGVMSHRDTCICIRLPKGGFVINNTKYI